MSFVHHIYIDDFRSFQKQDISLSGMCRFDYLENKVSIQKQIRDYPYMTGNLEHLKIIVGENGSGKSTLLSLLANSLPGGGPELQFEGMILFENKNKLFIGVTKKFLDVKIDSTFDRVEKVELSSIRDKYNPSKVNYFRDMNVFYYSNTFDYFSPDQEWSGLNNISTNYLMVKEVDPLSNIELRDKNGKSLDRVFSKIKYEEFKKNIYLLSSDEAYKFLPFTFRREISIRASDFHLLGLIANVEKIESSSKKSPWYARDLYGAWRKMAFDEKICFSPLIIILLLLYKDGFLKKNIMNKAFSYINSSDYYGLQSYLLSLDSTSPFNKKLMSLDNLYESYKVLKDYSEVQDERLVLSLENESSSYYARQFIKSYFDSVLIYEYISFDFGGFSTGEQSFLSLFSRIYYEFKNKEIDGNVIFLIDEGDVFLHPEWQRKYFYLVSSFLKAFGPKGIQLIMTSHSPFILSDVCKDHVVYLDGRKSMEIDTNTYGGNLFNIYEKGMFLTKPFGEGYYQKLKEVSLFIAEGFDEIDFHQAVDIMNFFNISGESFVIAELQKRFREEVRAAKGFGYLKELEMAVNKYD